MKLASFEFGGTPLIGLAVAGGELVDVTDIVGSDMIKLIAQADHMLPQLAGAATSKILARYATDAVRWLPPVRRPSKICVVGMNACAGEASTSGHSDEPDVTLTPSSSLIGHRESIVVRRYYGSVYAQAKLAVVIRKPARDVDADEAMDYVFGYTILNDVTGSKRSAGSDTFGCMGPWLVTADELHNPGELQVTCSVGSETLFEGATRDPGVGVAEAVSFITQFQTLEPGDVIACGTMTPPPRPAGMSRPGDLQDVDGPVEIQIPGLGVLSNPVVVEERDIGRWQR